jgi:hypothetical protein
VALFLILDTKQQKKRIFPGTLLLGKVQKSSKPDRQTERCLNVTSLPGANIVNSEIFSPKKWEKHLAILTQIAAV